MIPNLNALAGIFAFVYSDVLTFATLFDIESQCPSGHFGFSYVCTTAHGGYGLRRSLNALAGILAFLPTAKAPSGA